jgi:hypothetical protein
MNGMDDLTWRKARRSGEEGDHCVELASLPEAVAVRDSKRAEAGHLTFSRVSFRAAVMAADRR